MNLAAAAQIGIRLMMIPLRLICCVTAVLPILLVTCVTLFYRSVRSMLFLPVYVAFYNALRCRFCRYLGTCRILQQVRYALRVAACPVVGCRCTFTRTVRCAPLPPTPTLPPPRSLLPLRMLVAPGAR